MMGQSMDAVVAEFDRLEAVVAALDLDAKAAEVLCEIEKRDTCGLEFHANANAFEKDPQDLPGMSRLLPFGY